MNTHSLSLKDQAVLQYLITRAAETNGDGVRSREIADSCGLDIYSARYTLLKLTRMGYVVRNHAAGAKRHYWLPVKDSVPPVVHQRSTYCQSVN